MPFTFTKKQGGILSPRLETPLEPLLRCRFADLFPLLYHKLMNGVFVYSEHMSHDCGIEVHGVWIPCSQNTAFCSAKSVGGRLAMWFYRIPKTCVSRNHNKRTLAVPDLCLASEKFWHEEDVRAEMYCFGPFLEHELPSILLKPVVVLRIPSLVTSFCCSLVRLYPHMLLQFHSFSRNSIFNIFLACSYPSMVNGASCLLSSFRRYIWQTLLPGKEDEREQTSRWEIVSHNNFMFINMFVSFWKHCPFVILMRK